MKKKLLIVWVATALLFAACGKKNEVGQGIEVNDSGKIELCRLGEKCPTPAPKETQAGALGVDKSPSPLPPPPTTSKTQEPAIVVIIPEGQNYDPFQIELEPFAILKVVNKDCRAEVKNGRSFTESSDPPVFDSGLLKCNQEWTWTANVGGEFTVMDKSGFPANAKVIVE